MRRKASVKKIIPLYRTGTNSVGNENKHQLKRVAAYCRVSSDSEEQLHSLKAQVDYYKQHISANPDYEYAGIYADEGISGTGTVRREAFNRLMAHCRAGLIDLVITKSVSRFGRNTVDTLTAIRELKALGVDVYFEKENIHTLTGAGEVLLSLVSAVAQNEILTQSDNIKWGIRRKYEIGSVSSVPLGKFYGYDKVDGKLVINEAQAEVIRRIYQEFLDGYSYSQIASNLTADGIPTEQGNAVWRLTSVRQMLTNEKYKGDILLQKTYSTDHLTKHRAKNQGELPQYYLEGSHTGIVGKEMWECVQLELKRQQRYCQDHHISKYHHSNEEHPLSARITCAACGCTFVLLTSKRVGEEGRKYWRCSSFRGGHSVALKGRTFTPKPVALWSRYPDSSHARYRAKHRKLPKERQMLCNDVEIPAGVPEQAFVEAWNRVIGRREKYIDQLARIAKDSVVILIRYRAKELLRLIEAGEKLDQFDGYALSLKVLDHIEVGTDGGLEVVFLAGMRLRYK